MNTTLLISLVIIAVLSFFYFMKEKMNCPACSSEDLIKTGQKIYKESSNLILSGSPDSNYKFEFVCSKCGHKFWISNKIISTS